LSTFGLGQGLGDSPGCHPADAEDRVLTLCTAWSSRRRRNDWPVHKVGVDPHFVHGSVTAGRVERVSRAQRCRQGALDVQATDVRATDLRTADVRAAGDGGARGEVSLVLHDGVARRVIMKDAPKDSSCLLGCG
jgi:hypothetical protein